LPVDAHPEVQAELGAVAGLDGTDDFAATHGLANVERREYGLVAGNHVPRMFDRQHVSVDQEPRIVHHSIRRRVHVAGRGDVDSPVPGGIRRRGSDERADDPVASSNRPRPVRAHAHRVRPSDLRGHCGRNERRGNRCDANQCGEGDENWDRETFSALHPIILATSRHR
jgi:hypothetical protein